jgi:hypothetical protein
MATAEDSTGNPDLRGSAEQAREIAEEAREMADTRRDTAAASGPLENDVTREVYEDAAGALDRSDRVRAADDVRTGERQEELARMEADAAERLERNAEALRRTAEELRATRERLNRVSADTRELAADVRATREDTSHVAVSVPSTPPVVDPPAGE